RPPHRPGRRAFVSVRNTCSVSEIKYFLAGQEIAQGLHHRQAANAGVENANRTRVAHAAGTLTVLSVRRKRSMVKRARSRRPDIAARRPYPFANALRFRMIDRDD